MSRRQAAISLHILPPILFLFLTGIFVRQDALGTFEPPLLFPLLSTTFLTALPLAIALLAFKSFVERGPRVLVLVGCGLVAPAVAGLLAAWGLLANGPNFNVTVYNVGALIGGGCHVAAAVLLLFGSPRGPFQRRTAGLIAAGAGAMSALLVAAVAFLTVGGFTPVFFVPGHGATVIREVVLTAAGICYLLSAALIFGLHAQTGMAFFRLYANALFLMAIGLAAVALEKNTGSLLSWIGRVAQYAGSLYFVGALLVGQRETHKRGASLPSYLSELLRIHLDDEVRKRTRDLLALTERLNAEITERKQLLAELQESEERLRLAAEAAGFGVFSYDFKTRQAYFSPELLALFGLPPGAELPLDADFVPKAVHPEDRVRLAAMVRGAGDLAARDLSTPSFVLSCQRKGSGGSGRAGARPSTGAGVPRSRST